MGLAILPVTCRPMAQPYLIAAGKTRGERPLQIFSDTVTIKVSGADTGGKYTIIGGLTPPLGGPPLHRHEHDAETFFVVKGTFLFVLGEERVVVHEGDTLFIPPGVVHQYQNIGETPGELFLVVEPAGLDDFFIELDALLKATHPPDMGAVADLHSRYSLELLGPPLAAVGAPETAPQP
jgi:quercetin dioxygenase-like cupin family protein